MREAENTKIRFADKYTVKTQGRIGKMLKVCPLVDLFFKDESSWTKRAEKIAACGYVLHSRAISSIEMSSRPAFSRLVLA